MPGPYYLPGVGPTYVRSTDTPTTFRPGGSALGGDRTQLVAGPSPTTAALVDTFDADSGLWNFTGSYVITGGVLDLTPSFDAGGVYTRAVTRSAYDLRGSSLTVSIAQLAGGSYAADTEVHFGQDIGRDDLKFVFENGTLYFQSFTGTVKTTRGSVAFDWPTMNWWRLRHDGTTVYWETSGDGASWTSRASVAASSLPDLSAAHVILDAGYFDSGFPPSADAQFDSVNPPPVTSGPPAASGTWLLRLSEDFTGPLTAVDSTNGLYTLSSGGPTWRVWYPSYASFLANPYGPHQNNVGTGDVYYDASGLSVASGALSLTATHNTPNVDLAYTSGMIQSEPTITPTYGYAEARIKLPAADLSWPAFWMAGAASYDVNSDEFDQMENFGTADYYTITTWRNGSGGVGGDIYAYHVPTDVTAWHVYGVEWTPTKLTFYLDGVQVAQDTNVLDVPQRPMYLLLNLSVQKGANTAAYPATMQVDWVKFWQLPATAAPLSVCAATAAGGAVIIAGASGAATTSSSAVGAVIQLGSAAAAAATSTVALGKVATAAPAAATATASSSAAASILTPGAAAAASTSSSATSGSVTVPAAAAAAATGSATASATVTGQGSVAAAAATSGAAVATVIILAPASGSSVTASTAAGTRVVTAATSASVLATGTASATTASVATSTAVVTATATASTIVPASASATAAASATATAIASGPGGAVAASTSTAAAVGSVRVPAAAGGASSAASTAAATVFTLGPAVAVAVAVAAANASVLVLGAASSSSSSSTAATGFAGGTGATIAALSVAAATARATLVAAATAAAAASGTATGRAVVLGSATATSTATAAASGLVGRSAAAATVSVTSSAASGVIAVQVQLTAAAATGATATSLVILAEHIDLRLAAAPLDDSWATAPAAERWSTSATPDSWATRPLERAP